MAQNVIPSSEKVSSDTNLNGNNGLILYSYHHCYYSQKVLMALYEKKIPFTTKLVDITKKEQHQLWYLKINPRGEIPVLKDGVKNIPDSERIIQYLEDNFSNGEHTRLIPVDLGPEVKKKVTEFHKDIEKVPIKVITIGACVNDELCSKLKYPFAMPTVRKFIKASGISGGENLRNLATNLPEYRDILLQKAADHDKMSSQATNKSEFYDILDQVDQLLDKIEEELSSHVPPKEVLWKIANNKRGLGDILVRIMTEHPDWWLCQKRFTIADISLSVLLDRLSRLGLETHFWGLRRPYVRDYYRRVQERDSFKKTVPSFMIDVAIIVRNKGPLILGVSLLTVLTVIGGFIYFKK